MNNENYNWLWPQEPYILDGYNNNSLSMPKKNSLAAPMLITARTQLKRQGERDVEGEGNASAFVHFLFIWFSAYFSLLSLSLSLHVCHSPIVTLALSLTQRVAQFLGFFFLLKRNLTANIVTYFLQLFFL